MDSPEQPIEEHPVGPVATFNGNTTDLVALAAVGTAAISGLCCVTGGCGIYLLPVIGIALGAVGWIQSGQSVDPGRTRTLSIIAVISMAVVFALIVLAVVAYIAFIVITIVAASSSTSSPVDY